MNIIGIDLGTAFCAVAKINVLGKPEIIPFSQGGALLPSTLFFGFDKVHFGRDAINRSGENPNNFVDLVKRYMGEDYYPNEVNGQMMTPSHLTSLLLEHIKKDFESRYGKITRAIITVPAYFDEKRRDATLKAAKEAGLPVEGLFNEPTSAGLYYATQFKELNGRALVFDLGGGTFDVTILDINRKDEDVDVKVISSNGDHKLGGRDFDIAVLEELEKIHKEETGEDLSADSAEKQEALRDAEEKFKKPLSTNKKITARMGRVRIELTQEKFDELISIYAQKVEMLVESLLYENKLESSDIDHVLLVGGSSRIPYFHKYLEKLFGKKPRVLGNVDEAVALGAAIECVRRATEGGSVSNIDGHDVPDAVIGGVMTMDVEDVCNHSYGTLAITFDEITLQEVRMNSIIIPKNTPIPAKIKKTFYLRVDGQKAVDATVTQGESLYPDEVNIIKNEMFHLPSNETKQGDEIEVEYSYDIDQKMHCVFKHKKSNTTMAIFVDNLN